MSFNIPALRETARTIISLQFRKVQGTRATASDLIEESNRRITEKPDSFDIFLSHAFKDAELILGLLNKLSALGYRVYVDWVEDKSLSRDSVTKYTASILKVRMHQSKCLLYATTENSSNSKWMPWELGYMDGIKDRAAILPIFNSANVSSYHYNGQEYLGIYPYCIKTTYKFRPDEEGLWIFENETTYTDFDSWLKGGKPTTQL